MGESKIALVTGAAHGIGRRVAERLSQSSWHVLACDLDEESLESLAQLPGLSTIRADVSSEHDVAALACTCW